MEKMIMEMILRIKDRLFGYEKLVLIFGVDEWELDCTESS